MVVRGGASGDFNPTWRIEVTVAIFDLASVPLVGKPTLDGLDQAAAPCKSSNGISKTHLYVISLPSCES